MEINEMLDTVNTDMVATNNTALDTPCEVPCTGNGGSLIGYGLCLLAGAAIKTGVDFAIKKYREHKAKKAAEKEAAGKEETKA